MQTRARRLLLTSLLFAALLLAVRPPQSAAALDAGTNATVSADGDCLRLRLLPGLASTILTCIPDGSLVSVLGGEAVVDGIQWQRLAFAGQSGWSNGQYLRAADDGAQAPAGPPEASLSGSVPTSGIGLAVWSGGAVDGMLPLAAQRGCTLRAVWTTPSGTFIGYIFGAPAVVNAQWNATYPGNLLSANSPVIVICGANAAGAAPSAVSPAPTSSAPAGPGQVALVPRGVPSTPPGPAGNR